MKARMRWWNGKWWCRRMGCTGCGDTMEDAWNDSLGCDDAYLDYTGYREQATEHDKMADAIEQLLPSNV